MKIKTLFIVSVLTIPLLMQEAISQVPPPQPQDGVPIDGLSILAVLGVIYGVKKLWQKKK
jgi:hypothetical protein